MEDIKCSKCGSEDYVIRVTDIHHTAYCNSCGAYIKHVPKDAPTLYFGKYTGMKIADCDDINYLNWLLQNTKQGERIKKAIINRLVELTY